jgi:hypothetical protein
MADDPMPEDRPCPACGYKGKVHPFRASKEQPGDLMCQVCGVSWLTWFAATGQRRRKKKEGGGWRSVDARESGVSHA